MPKSDNDKIAGPETIKRLEEMKVPWIGYVAVTPAMRGKGVAKEMVMFCAQRARELGHKEIWVKVEKKNIGIVELMKKAGFIVTEEINHIMYAKRLLEAD